MWTWLTVLPVLALLVVEGQRSLTFPENPTDSAVHAYALRTGVATAIVGLLVVGLAEAQRAADRRIAKTLPLRFSRPEHVPWLIIVGRVRALFLLVALTGQAAVVVALFLAPAAKFGAYRYGVLIAFVGCTAAAVLGVTRQVRRPSVAVDAASLAIDERLRSQDAFLAVWPLMYLAIESSTGLNTFNPPAWLFFMSTAITVLSFATYIWAQSVSPWPKPQAIPWGARPAQPAR